MLTRIHYNSGVLIVSAKNMNKAQLIDAIAARTEHTKKDCDAIVSAMLDIIQTTVADGEKVTLVGFGTFEPRDRQAREGRNPRTGETMQIPATKIPAFAAGKIFKERVCG